MNVKHLEYFSVLAEEGNVTRAAARIGISQPTLTQALQKVERELGVSLFEREGRDLRITPYGGIFLEAGGYITDVYANALKRIEDLRQGRTGTIRLHIAPSRAPFTLPGALRRFSAKYPDVCVEVAERLTAQILRNVETGEADIGVLVTKLAEDPRIEYVPLERESVLVAARRDLFDPGAGCRENAQGICSAPIEAFAGIPFVLLGEDQLLVSQFREYCAARGADIRCAMRCRNVETSLSLANAGLGATLVTSAGMAYYRSSFPNLRYYDVASGALTRDVCLIHRKRMFLNEAQRYLIESIKTKE